MRVISGILILVAVSGVSANASAAKFDLNSALNSVLKIVLDTSQFDDVSETKPSIIESDYSDATIYSPIITGCRDYIDCQNFPEKRRMIHRDLENKPYICFLDDSEGAARQDGYFVVGGDGFAVYASDQWLNAEKECVERSNTVRQRENQERKRAEKIEAERRAKIPKKPEAKIGMTKDQVKKSRWGTPTYIDITTNSKGTYEKWRYYLGTLYFTNGKLTSIEQSKHFLMD